MAIYSGVASRQNVYDVNVILPELETGPNCSRRISSPSMVGVRLFWKSSFLAQEFGFLSVGMSFCLMNFSALVAIMSSSRVSCISCVGDVLVLVTQDVALTSLRGTSPSPVIGLLSSLNHPFVSLLRALVRFFWISTMV